jgi:pimeloyl-ACP methyl ester carboxylesterase
MTTTTHQITLAGSGQVDVTVDDRGQGRPFLLLHGGAGPQSVTGFAGLLAEREHARTITPTHPGFGGTRRPDWLNSVAGLAMLYRELLEQLELQDVTVIGNSIGGWIAAELGVLGTPRISGIVLVDAAGIEVKGHPVADIFPLTLDELSQLSYHDPATFRVDPAALTEEQQAGMAANRAVLRVYGGQPSMADPTLRGRLGRITVPALVLWGDSDQIVDADYGRAYAAAIPGARFQLLPATGHVPQIETPAQLLQAIAAFVTTPA